MPKKINDLITYWENREIGFWQWLVVVLLIIFIRDTLESIVTTASFPIPDQFHLLHVPIFFISVFLGIVIILHIFSKEDILKISRIGLVFFPIIISPALVDFFFFLLTGHTIEYRYILNNLKINFINFLNPFFKIEGAPYTVRLEIGVISILSFIYIFIKRRRLVFSLLGAFFIFCLCFFFATLPAIITQLISYLFRFLFFVFNFLGIKDRFYPAYTFLSKATLDEAGLVLIEMMLAFFLVAVWYFCYAKEKFKALLKNLRLTRSFHYLLMTFMGLLVYFSSFLPKDFFILIRALSILIAIFFACQFSAILNDTVDFNSDKLSNPLRPLPKGIFKKEEYLKVGFVYLGFCLLFSWWVGDNCFVITLLFIVLYSLYSLFPFRIKRFYPFSSLVIGLESVLAFILGEVSLKTEEMLSLKYPLAVWLIFLVFSLSSNIKDLKDVEADKIEGVITLPVIFGRIKAQRIIAFLVMLSYLFVPIFVMRYVSFVGIIWLISLFWGGANFLYIYKTKHFNEQIVFILYFIYAFILMASFK